jgi:hypothetical protein
MDTESNITDRLPYDSYYEAIHKVRFALPPALEETPEAYARRDRGILNQIKQLVPASAIEAEFAAKCVACGEVQMGCLREIRELGKDHPKQRKLLFSQAAAMGREARGHLASLLKVQATRTTREKTETGAYRADAMEEYAGGLMFEALADPPGASPAASSQEEEDESPLSALVLAQAALARAGGVWPGADTAEAADEVPTPRLAAAATAAAPARATGDAPPADASPHPSVAMPQPNASTVRAEAAPREAHAASATANAAARPPNAASPPAHAAPAQPNASSLQPNVAVPQPSAIPLQPSAGPSRPQPPQARTPAPAAAPDPSSPHQAAPAPQPDRSAPPACESAAHMRSPPRMEPPPRIYSQPRSGRSSREQAQDDDWPKLDLAHEAEQYAIHYPKRAQLIRRLGGLPANCSFGPPEPDLVRAIVIGTSPALRALDQPETGAA